MFATLTDRLSAIFDRLKGRGTLGEADVTAALVEIRQALLEADVALPVVKDLIEAIRTRAVGQEVVRSVSPGQMVVKIVHDHLVETLGRKLEDLNLKAQAPVVFLMVGLQGSGKTTTTAKLGRYLTEQRGRKVLMASLDVRRPAAQEQLRVLGDQVLVPTVDIVVGQGPQAIAERALQQARREGYDTLLLDTAGRLAIDDALMAEAKVLKDLTRPAEVLLVADAMTGQDAVTIAKNFQERVGLTGIVLTRVDGDARGGAALSMRATAGVPIKLMGTGEKLDALEPFHPERIAGRILGMGDVVSLVEKAASTIEQKDAERLAARLERGQFDFNDMDAQLGQLTRMGGLAGVMSFLPGLGKFKSQIESAKIDEKAIRRQQGIIRSMTPEERRKPMIIKASRRKRIAAGSGTSVQDVNRLLKQFQDMQTMVKRVGKLSHSGGLARSMPGLFNPGLKGQPRPR
ncbi:MAG: signal recognition particle protein [Alphaproteobacteria bacterium]|nr:signal recognition particle protein [Alphaproteobacteria bacterium]